MGGLVIQRMLLDHPEIASRVFGLAMFGTPNGGVPLANLLDAIPKKPLKNMQVDCDFIKKLRCDWQANRPDHLQTVTVLGANDSLVPRESAFKGFGVAEQDVVEGSHLSMVRPKTPETPAVQIVIDMANQVFNPENLVPVQMAAVMEPVDPCRTYVDRALQLERAGEPVKAIAVLREFLSDRRLAQGDLNQYTDALGSLGGQLKRYWLNNQQESLELAEANELNTIPDQVMRCYTDALYQSVLNQNDEQIYYHAINVAFCSLMWFDDDSLRTRAANLALKHIQISEDNFWKSATIAEANLYMLDFEAAAQHYREAFALPAEQIPFNYDTTITQALTVLDQLAKKKVIEESKTIGTIQTFMDIFRGLPDAPSDQEFYPTELS